MTKRKEIESLGQGKAAEETGRSSISSGSIRVSPLVPSKSQPETESVKVSEKPQTLQKTAEKESPKVRKSSSVSRPPMKKAGWEGEMEKRSQDEIEVKKPAKTESEGTEREESKTVEKGSMRRESRKVQFNSETTAAQTVMKTEEPAKASAAQVDVPPQGATEMESHQEEKSEEEEVPDLTKNEEGKGSEEVLHQQHVPQDVIGLDDSAPQDPNKNILSIASQELKPIIMLSSVFA